MKAEFEQIWSSALSFLCPAAPERPPHAPVKKRPPRLTHRLQIRLARLTSAAVGRLSCGSDLAPKLVRPAGVGVQNVSTRGR
jgi:hypothetical protein